jgi:aerobic carbon-monoxide dehydrogenase small subunit
MRTTFDLNGEACHFDGDPLTPLIDVLRHHRFLTGTKSVCGEGFCGACIVHIDGEPVPACLRPVGLLDGCAIVTIEGASISDPDVRRLQRALEKVDAVQCGMCFPGMVMSLSAFLREMPDADRPAVKHAMVGNICRCTGYERIVDAVMDCLAADTPTGDADA